MLAERMANEFPHDTWGVLSISLGGMVALALASLLPMRVSRLVLVNASSRLSPPSQRLLPAGRRQLLKAARVRGHHERERLILGVTTDPGRREFDDWVQHAAAISRHTPASPRAVARQLLGAARFYPPRVEQPTLVLSGAKDKLVSPSCSTALAHYLHAPHHIHPTAGHDLPLEEPVWVVAQIATWLGLGQAADTLEISRCETSVPQPPATGPRGEPHY
jgi:pimeloyl-ACP methyl ester carboxylesterase